MTACSLIAALRDELAGEKNKLALEQQQDSGNLPLLFFWKYQGCHKTNTLQTFGRAPAILTRLVKARLH